MTKFSAVEINAIIDFMQLLDSTDNGYVNIDNNGRASRMIWWCDDYLGDGYYCSKHVDNIPKCIIDLFKDEIDSVGMITIMNMDDAIHRIKQHLVDCHEWHIEDVCDEMRFREIFR